jgi:hypothetical protein
LGRLKETINKIFLILAIESQYQDICQDLQGTYQITVCSRKQYQHSISIPIDIAAALFSDFAQKSLSDLALQFSHYKHSTCTHRCKISLPVCEISGLPTKKYHGVEHSFGISLDMTSAVSMHYAT